MINRAEFGKRVLAVVFGSQFGLLLSVFSLSREGWAAVIVGGPLLPLFSSIRDEGAFGFS